MEHNSIRPLTSNNLNFSPLSLCFFVYGFIGNRCYSSIFFLIREKKNNHTFIYNIYLENCPKWLTIETFTKSVCINIEYITKKNCFFSRFSSFFLFKDSTSSTNLNLGLGGWCVKEEQMEFRLYRYRIRWRASPFTY